MQWQLANLQWSAHFHLCSETISKFCNRIAVCTSLIYKTVSTIVLPTLVHVYGVRQFGHDMFISVVCVDKLTGLWSCVFMTIVADARCI